MRINKKNRINVKKVIGIIIAFTIIITSIISPNISSIANAAEVKSTSDENGVINIPLEWSKNNMNAVNSDISVDSNRYKISTNYFDIFSKNNVLSPKNADAMKYSWFYRKWYSTGENAIGKTGNILRTPMLVDPTSNTDDLYTIDYRDLEKWFEPPGSNGIEPISLPQTKDVWNENLGKSASWQQTSSSEYTSQDWYMFRGIFDLDNTGINKNNIDEYKFYLAMPDESMILGVNDLVSVFVDEHSTDINYATPPSFDKNDTRTRKINFIMPRDGNKLIEYKNASTNRYSGSPTYEYNQHDWDIINSLGDGIDGWHVDLNQSLDNSGHAILGDVTDIIKSNTYGNNKHMIDMLASEWCGSGGMTRLALYAVKKPSLNVEKIAYVHSTDKNKINQSDIKSIEDNGDIILNTYNHIPSIPADTNVYFKFKISVKDSNINNVIVTDKNTDMGIDYKYNIGNMTKGSSRIIKDESKLKFTNRSTDYNELNEEFTNMVNAKGTYFNNQITVTSSNYIKLKTYFEPNISVKKTLVSINGKDIDYNKEKKPLVAGDKVKFNISVTNNSSMAIGGLSLKDTLKNDGENDLTDWKFTCDTKNIDSNNFTLNPGQTVNFSTDWTVTNIKESKGNNTAYIDINGFDKEFKSNEVDFNIKDKKGNINVTKNIENYANLSDSDKNNVDKQLFTINLIDNTDGTVQTVAIKNGQTAQFVGVKYGDNYTIKESIPMNYKLESIKVNKDKSDTFTMGFDTDNSKVTVTNSYSDNGWFEWYENVANKLRTASNL